MYELRDIAQRNERIEAHLMDLEADDLEQQVKDEEYEHFMEPSHHFPVVPIVPI